MKNLFHLGTIAFTAITFSSCSRSANDLAVQNKTTTNVTANATAKTAVTAKTHKGLNLNDFIVNATSFYPLINQPMSIKLGNDPNSNIPTGNYAVFYIVLSPDVANEQISNPILSTIDDATGQVIQTYNLLGPKDVPSVDVTVPDALINQPFMFAIVYLGDQYTNKSISLYSEIGFNNAISVATLTNAFMVTP